MEALKKTEIISITTVKPSSPTPTHLQSFRLSLPDQLSPNVYPNMTFFYPFNTAAADLHHLHGYTDFFNSKSKLLQRALSETLTHFYPLAGRFQDDGKTILCNDEGVVFTESKSNYLLSDILASPDFDLIYNEFVSTNYHEAKQVSNGSILLFNFILFNCGGTAVSFAASHKVLDLSSWMTFFKSLSAACCGSAAPILPDFHSASTLFPSREMPNNATFGDLKKFSTRSFVFTAAKVQELKAMAASCLEKEGYEFGYLSRVNVVMAFLWQCLLNSYISQGGSFRSTVMLQAANLRNRCGEALPSNAMGSLAFLYATDIVQKESDVQVSELLKKLLELKVSIDKKANSFDADEVFRILTQENKDIFSKKDELNIYVGSSWCRFGLYEIDFGMGKPVWVTSVAPEILTNCINLLDTKEEGGIEALVYLEEEAMKALEGNLKLQHFAVRRSIYIVKSSTFIHSSL